MELNDYHRLISSECGARKYLLGICVKNHQRSCPRCRCRKLYKLQERHYRSSRCQYTFRDFSGRWINRGRLSCVQWLSLIKLFELEVSVQKMSLQLGMSYRAVYNADSTIRMVILSHAEDAPRSLDGEIEIDESYFGGAGARESEAGRQPEKCRFSASWSATAGFMSVAFPMSRRRRS